MHIQDSNNSYNITIQKCGRNRKTSQQLSTATVKGWRNSGLDEFCFAYNHDNADYKIYKIGLLKKGSGIMTLFKHVTQFYDLQSGFLNYNLTTDNFSMRSYA